MDLFADSDSDIDCPKISFGRGHGQIVDFNTDGLMVDRLPRFPPLELRKIRTEEENVDIFARKFKKEIRRLNLVLDRAERFYEYKKTGYDDDPGDEGQLLAEVDEKINELQKYITSSTRFLPDFAIKTSQELLNTLNLRYREVRQRIMPTKKFQFNSRKKKPVEKKELTLEEFIARNERCKEELLAEKRIHTFRTSELSLDMSDCTDRYICDVGNRVNKHDITLTNMRNCFIEIRGHPGSIRMRNIVKCVLLCGPTTFSIYGEDCHMNIFAIACHQFRIHYSTATKIFLHVTSRAIMEECREIDIGRYNYKYDGLEQDFKDSGLDINTNNYKDMGDFDWLSADAPSPNWKLTEEQMDWDKLRQQFKEQVMKVESPK